MLVFRSVPSIKREEKSPPLFFLVKEYRKKGTVGRKETDEVGVETLTCVKMSILARAWIGTVLRWLQTGAC